MAADAKKKKAKSEEGSFLSGITTYFKEVRSELKKVSWPERDDVVRLTRIVLLTTVVSSLVLGAMSVLFSLYVEEGLKFPIIFVAVFVGAVLITGYLFRRDNTKVSY